LKKYRWQGLQNLHNLSLHELDITDESELDQLFSRGDFDAVINLAAMAGVRYSITNPKKYFDVNSSGIITLLERMKKHRVKQLIQASTSSLYAGMNMPFEETLDVRKPISPYAASKLSAESAIHAYCHLQRLNATVLRFFTVYGPAGRPDMAPYRFIEWCLQGEKIKLFGDGSQSRDFTFIDDIAFGVIAALKHNLDGFEIINLGGGGRRKTISEMIQMIGALTDRTPKIEYLPNAKGDMLHTGASIDKARQLLNWSPKVEVYEGLKRSVDWHLSEIPSPRYSMQDPS
jgi:nucleoside-diphosphate-sugar epimerase